MDGNRKYIVGIETMMIPPYRASYMFNHSIQAIYLKGNVVHDQVRNIDIDMVHIAL